MKNYYWYFYHRNTALACEGCRINTDNKYQGLIEYEKYRFRNFITCAMPYHKLEFPVGEDYDRF